MLQIFNSNPVLKRAFIWGNCTPFFEWKTSDDYRTAAYVYAEEGISCCYVHGDNVAKDNYGKYREYWAIENRSIPVSEDDGRFWWAVNGDVIADYHGPNKKRSRLTELCFSPSIPLNTPSHIGWMILRYGMVSHRGLWISETKRHQCITI